ncbi:HAMP domain-containing histidine kinase [Clostridium swellfunianum]|uniref:sensor histidine kinase n=1 Tax=Clostridium swellfunianum TaxID=1367462 RepID=UPI002030056F|nr:HAMP domain-containing sensor histidine kinase [Clostridium swellfunianum]MCM0650697.1 HAMP domain-containing histidine kinase [Clostridium swellfunianum]
MDKITIKLAKYFLTIITIIIVICFAASSVFLSRFYLNSQYDNLENSAREIYKALSNKEPIAETNISAILINGDNITSLTHGKMGMMPFLRSVENISFKTKGIFTNAMDAEFLYYNLQTDLGNIVVFQNNNYSSEYLRVVYITLFFIFISALLLSIPLISFIGKKFTKPVLQIEKAASSISKGDFDVNLNIKTKDEIETLSNSINQMALDLKKKYQLQRDFIANVSHDFKTPLSVIRSYSEAIKDELVDESETKKYSNEIIKEVDRLNSMVMDLLQLSKLQDGAYILNRQYVNLSELVNVCTNQFRIISAQKNITTLVNVPSIEIYADLKYLQRVLYNFLDNAIKFSMQNGKVEVFTSYDGENIKLSVKDYGEGIKPHELDEIWNKYYKNSQSGGMGLGLPICREILKMHGFHYGVTSSFENGTEFYFIIPKNYLKI